MAQGKEADVKSVRVKMSDRLPGWMVPDVIVRLDEMPMSSNGKVARNRLPEVSFERPEMESEYAAPETDAERAIAALWREVLQVDEVGRNDNFFDLGGHSLLVLEVYSRLSESFGHQLSKLDLFKYPTIASLAQYIAREQEQPSPAAQSDQRAQARKESLVRRSQSRRATRR